jgi:hypothetical protein
MTIQKILFRILAVILTSAAFTVPLMSEGREQPTQQELEIREKVIQDIVAESYGHRDGLFGPYSYRAHRRAIYRCYRASANRIHIQRARESELESTFNFGNLPVEEQSALFTTRNMAIAGVSAGGILYFLPGQNIFFWETDEDNLPEGSIRDGILMNPVIGGILSGVLASAQRDLKNNNNKFMGSKKLGAMALVVLNPAEAFVQNTNSAAGHRIFTSGSTEITTVAPVRPYDPVRNENKPTNYIGLQFQIRF